MNFSNPMILLFLLPALLNVGIVVYVYRKLPRSKVTDLFALCVLALAIWQVEDSLYLAAETREAAYFIDKIFAFSWIAVNPLALHFAISYTGLAIERKRWFVVANYLPFLLLQGLYISDNHNLLVADPMWGWVVTPSTGWVDALLLWVMAGSMLTVVGLLVRHAIRMRTNPAKKMQTMLVAAGVLIPTVGGIITQVVFPLVLNRNEVPLTSLLITFFSIGTITALSRYRLFDALDALSLEAVLGQLRNLVLVVHPDRTVHCLNEYSREVLLAPGKQSCFATQLFENAEAAIAFDREVIEPALNGQAVRNYTVVLQTGRQQPLQVLMTAEPIRTQNTISGLLLVANDVTEYLQVVEELKRSNERYQLISKASNDMVWDWDVVSGKVYRSEEGWQKIFGQRPRAANTTVQEWAIRLHPEDKWIGDQLMSSVYDGSIGESFDLEFRVLTDEGAVLYLRDRGYVVKDAGGKPVRLLGATQDITRRRLAEKQLEEQRQQRHREITEAVLAAQENERRLIGAELHDNVNQILTSARLYLNLARTEPEQREKFITLSEEILARAMNEVRKLSHTLIPPTLSGETLVEALHHLFEASERTGLFEVQLDVQYFDEEVLSPKLKLSLYRIVQEQLSNIIRHAGARKVQVTLRQLESNLLLEVRDDGSGFDKAMRALGVGMKNMETRAALHNGQFIVESAPGAGCLLQVLFPFSQMQAAQSD